MLHDFLHGLRALARDPGFAAIAVLTLTIGLGASTIVFSVMNSAVLRPLPYPESEEVVAVTVWMPPREGRPGNKYYLDGRALRSWQRSSQTVEHVAAYRERLVTLGGGEGPERLSGASVSPALFTLLRVVPVRGRTFREEEQQGRVVILSHRLWQRRFQGDPKVLGKAVTLEGAPHVIVGVMPRTFFFPTHEVELWTPLAVGTPAGPATGGIHTQYFPAVARVKDGVSREQAEAEVQGILRAERESGAATGDEAAGGRVRLTPLREEMVAGVRPALMAISLAVGLVLLMACINLATLLSVRSTAKEREMAIRSAVGATRGRLLRQVLGESAALSLAEESRACW